MTSEEVFASLNEFLQKNPNATALRELLENNKGSYLNAYKYSEVVGEGLFSELSKIYDFASVADLEMLANDVELIMKFGYAESAQYACDVQAIINSQANIGMKALHPAIDEYRITNLTEQILSGDISNVLVGTFTNTAKSAVTDTIQYNARVQKEAGLKPIMTRHLGVDGCCDWCRSMAGSYEYGKQPNDFWRFHHDCDCWVEYKVKKDIRKVSYSTEYYVDDKGKKKVKFNKVTENF